MTTQGVTVIKVGGSILRNEDAYYAAARRIAEEIEREPTWVVVSAAHRFTDALEGLTDPADPEEIAGLVRRQTELTGVPMPSSLESELREGAFTARTGSRDRLLAWGERASAVALQAHVARTGVDVPIVELDPSSPPPWRPAALVPGFFVCDSRGEVRCFPRGGSDISAVLVGFALGTNTVRFWKDGGGIRSNEGTVSEINSASLRARLTNTVRPLHPVALELAHQGGIDLILEDPFGVWPSTRVVVPAPQRRSNRAPSASRPPHASRTHEAGWERTVLAGLAGVP